MPSIDYNAASDLLIAAIVLIPSWFEQNKDHARLVTLVINHVAEAALVRTYFHSEKDIDS